MTYYRQALLGLLVIGGCVVLGTFVARRLPSLSRRAAWLLSRLTIAVALSIPLIVALARDHAAALYAEGVQWVPGRSIAGMLRQPNHTIAAANLLGNVALFVPFGFVAVSLTRLRLRYVLLTGFTASAVIELLQWVTRRGSADVDDVLLNFTGVVLGALAAAWHGRRTQHPAESDVPRALPRTPSSVMASHLGQ